MIQIDELNKLIKEISEIYSQKVKSIVNKNPESEHRTWELSDLEELRRIKQQLNLLFSIRDSCYKILDDINRLKDSFDLLQ